MVNVQVSVTGATQAAAAFQRDADRLDAPIPGLLESIGIKSAQELQANIREGRIQFPPLSPITLAIRRRHGHEGKPTLIRGGDLVDSIMPLRSDGRSVTIGTALVFGSGLTAADLDQGGRVTDDKGRTRDLPAFPFIDMTEPLLGSIETLVADHYFPAPEWSRA